MEYQKIINLIDDTTNQSSKFSARDWVELNDESKGRYDNGTIRFKSTVIRSRLCDYCGAYIIAKGTITVPNSCRRGSKQYK